MRLPTALQTCVGSLYSPSAISHWEATEIPFMFTKLLMWQRSLSKILCTHCTTNYPRENLVWGHYLLHRVGKRFITRSRFDTTNLLTFPTGSDRNAYLALTHHNPDGFISWVSHRIQIIYFTIPTSLPSCFCPKIASYIFCIQIVITKITMWMDIMSLEGNKRQWLQWLKWRRKTVNEIEMPTNMF